MYKVATYANLAENSATAADRIANYTVRPKSLGHFYVVPRCM